MHEVLHIWFWVKSMFFINVSVVIFIAIVPLLSVCVYTLQMCRVSEALCPVVCSSGGLLYYN